MTTLGLKKKIVFCTVSKLFWSYLTSIYALFLNLKLLVVLIFSVKVVKLIRKHRLLDKSNGNSKNIIFFAVPLMPNLKRSSENFSFMQANFHIGLMFSEIGDRTKPWQNWNFSSEFSKIMPEVQKCSYQFELRSWCFHIFWFGW